MLAETDHPAKSVAAAVMSASKAVAAAGPAETAEDRARARRAVLKTEAQAAAHSAIAAATTEHERHLIGRIFDAIPSVIALSQAHSEADASNAPSLDRDRDLWEEGRAQVEALAVEVTELPTESAADALRRVMLYRQVIAWTEGAPLNHGFEGVFEEDMQIMGVAAIGALATLADRPVGDLAAWDAAKIAYEEAVSRSDAANAASKAAHDEVEKLPFPGALLLSEGRCYFREEHIERDISNPIKGNERLTITQAAEKLAVLREFMPKREALIAELRVEDLEHAYDAALVEQGRLAEDLINTPAPNTAAALYKMQVLLYEWHGIQTPDSVAEALSGTDPDPWGVVRVLQDLLRITGSTADIKDIQPFDSEAFIAAFEQIPGCQMTERGPRYEQPAAWPGLMSSADFDRHFVLKDEAKIRAYMTAVGCGEDGDRIQQYVRTGIIVSAHNLPMVYPDDPEKVAELQALADEQARLRKSRPSGADQWDALTEWQKEAVRQTAKLRSTTAGAKS